MVNKKLTYGGIGLIVLLLVGSFILTTTSLNGAKIIETKGNNPDLDKYRSEDIPSDCRLPPYETDVEEWKQHLSHHQETLYCLNYYD